MTAAELLGVFLLIGAELSVKGDRLHCRVPRGMMTPELHVLMAEQKAELILALTAKPESNSNPPWCGQRVRIDELVEFKARYNLKTVGGHSDLRGRPWQPKLYMTEAK